MGGAVCKYYSCNHTQDCPADDDSDANFRDKQCKSRGNKWIALDEGNQHSIHISSKECMLTVLGTYKFIIFIAIFTLTDDYYDYLK